MPRGTIKCWGNNDHGSLGDGTTVTSLTSVDVLGIENATSIALGRHESYALMPGGKIKAWGNNNGGQLGDGTVKHAHRTRRRGGNRRRVKNHR